jgi:predicted GNAT superfamily acetyltransferase
MMNAEITIRTLTSIEEMERVEELQRVIWPGSEIDIVPVHLIKTIARNGGIVIGALEGEELRGYVFGFLGTAEFGKGRPASESLRHCSHQLGVHPDYRNRQLGYRLKLAQRKAVMEQGIQLATWTYDPLLSLNGHLNVRRLGVVCNRYLRDAYGSMRDGLNIGLPSDRFDIDWYVDSPRVIDRVEKGIQPPGLMDYLQGGAVILNPTTMGNNGVIYPPEQITAPQSSMVLVEIPSDYMHLKKVDFELARAWRVHTRRIFEDAFATDYLVSDFLFVKDGGESRSYYLLARSEVIEGLR